MKGHIKDYEDLSKKELIHRVEEMAEVINQLEKHKNETELLSFPWVGNLGQWHWMVQSNELSFNEKKATNLGYKSEEIPEDVGFEYFTEKLHPDDYERVMDNMRRHLMNETDAYEVEYRICNKNGNYVWYYDRGKVTKRTTAGEPIVVSGIVFDISKNKELENNLIESNEKLYQLAITDELTSAYNRRFMIRKMTDEIQRYNRTKLAFSLIMFDIDKFKSINDKLGHEAGDIVLEKVVEVIKKRIRRTDVLSRWGGDEFIILLPDTNKSNAVKLAESIKIEINNLVIENLEKVTASIGVSSYYYGDNIEESIKKVDDLMYEAKSVGENHVKY